MMLSLVLEDLASSPIPGLSVCLDVDFTHLVVSVSSDCLFKSGSVLLVLILSSLFPCEEPQLP